MNDLLSVEKLLSIDSETLHKLPTITSSRRNSLRSDPSTGQTIEEEEVEYDDPDISTDDNIVQTSVTASSHNVMAVEATITDVATPEETHDHLVSVVLVDADEVTSLDIGLFVIGTNPTSIHSIMRDKSCEIVIGNITANNCLAVQHSIELV